jgi:hypothetical protein
MKAFYFTGSNKLFAEYLKAIRESLKSNSNK